MPAIIIFLLKSIRFLYLLKSIAFCVILNLSQPLSCTTEIRHISYTYYSKSNSLPVLQTLKRLVKTLGLFLGGFREHLEIEDENQKFQANGSGIV